SHRTVERHSRLRRIPRTPCESEHPARARIGRIADVMMPHFCSEKHDLEQEIMTSQNLGLRIAGALFALVALGHLLRLLLRAEVLIAGWSVPHWVSVLGFFVTG